MSRQRFTKAPGDSKPTYDGGVKSRPGGLREISLESWKDWDNVTAELKDYFHSQFGELGNIFPDPLKIVAELKYRDAIEVSDITFPPESLTVLNDPVGTMRARYNSAWSEAEKKNTRYQDDRRLGYWVIRNITSTTVNNRLALEPSFVTIQDDNPLNLFKLIKVVVMSRSMGNAVKDKSNAWYDWHTLSMSQGELITNYARRATTILDRLIHAKIDAKSCPLALNKP